MIHINYNKRHKKIPKKTTKDKKYHAIRNVINELEQKMIVDKIRKPLLIRYREKTKDKTIFDI